MPFEKWATRKGDSIGYVYDAYRVSRRLSLVKFYMDIDQDGFILVKASAYEKLGADKLDHLFDECLKSPKDFYHIDEHGMKRTSRRAPNFG